jgi:hypothetical protein
MSTDVPHAVVTTPSDVLAPPDGYSIFETNQLPAGTAFMKQGLEYGRPTKDWA